MVLDLTSLCPVSTEGKKGEEKTSSNKVAATNGVMGSGTAKTNGVVSVSVGEEGGGDGRVVSSWCLTVWSTVTTAFVMSQCPVPHCTAKIVQF